MKALVVYESMYGNTAAVGEAIAASLRANGLEVSSGPVTAIGPAEAAGAELLVVGGPTHAHGMSRSATRKTAAEDKKNAYAHPTVAPGLREWMDGLPPDTRRRAAAFDTRIEKPAILTGSAAKGIAKRLKHHGFRLVVEPECFFVSTDNQLLENEIDHATTWGNEVAASISWRPGMASWTAWKSRLESAG
jgi:flavorubredoxin